MNTTLIVIIVVLGVFSIPIIKMWLDWKERQTNVKRVIEKQNSIKG